MGPHEEEPDVEAGGSPQLDGHNEPYHDESDDDATIGPAAPLRGSQRPSTDFDGLHLGGPAYVSWRDRMADRIPAQLKSAWQATVEWVKGPDPPCVFKITPIFPKIQHAPLALLDRYAPKRIHRFGLLVLLYACWLLTFSLVLRASSFSASIPGYDYRPVRFSCSSRYWADGNGCGLNGDQCRPFIDSTLAFRCPANCLKQQMLNPHAVGDQEVVYKPLVVGGPTSQETGWGYNVTSNAIYRGDSFICGSAVHSGFVNDAEGGCGVLKLTGEQASFESSKHFGIESVGFDSYFPHSFGFLTGTRAKCQDLRWPALAVSVFFTAVLSLFTTSPGVFFWSVFVILFFQTGLASDPPNLGSYVALLSIAFGRFLPAAFCGWVTYRYTVKRTLTGLTAQIEKTVLWLGPAWVGALNNETFDKIPIQRLTPHDIQAQPGAIPALIIVVFTIFSIALGQAWAFRVEGRMPRYLAIYGLMVGTLLIMLVIPGLSLRIHHYILALLLLPGTSFQNRPSLVYQGLLVGMFINGIARWGFDSVLQTPGELLRGVAQGSLLPAITVMAMGARNITFNLGPLLVADPKLGRAYDGISVLVNDVERFRGYADDEGRFDEGSEVGGDFFWTWTRHQLGRKDIHQDVDKMPEYFRFAYVSGSQTADFTKAGRWGELGDWTEMEPGPSR